VRTGRPPVPPIERSAKGLTNASMMSGRGRVFGTVILLGHRAVRLPRAFRHQPLATEANHHDPLPQRHPYVSFCLETPAEAAPTPPDAGRGSPARWFPDKNYVSMKGLESS
jgi:hypothetical protein